MSDITVGSVSVEVVPDARRFPPKLARQVNPEAAKIGAEFGRLFGEAAQREMAKGVRDGLGAGSRDTAARGAKQGETYGGSFARALKARLEAAFRSLPDIQINADSTGADREIAAIRAQLAELRDKRVGVDIDAGAALAEVERLSEHLRLLSQQSPDVQVRVEAGAASAELAKFGAEVNRLDGQHIDVDVDVDTAAASAQLALLNGQARGAGGGFTALLGAALLLGPALIPIGAAGAGAMAAIATGALAAAGGLGVLILALAPVIAAVQAVRAAHDKSAQSARGSTSAHLQMASAMDAVKTAQAGLKSAIEDARQSEIRSAEAVQQAKQGLADAERDSAQDRIDAERRVADAQEQAARQQEESARRVIDARSGLARAVRQSALDQVEAGRRVVDAERSLQDAQRASLDAQRALSDARKDAARDAEDLATRLADGRLDERDGVLRVQEAQLDLQKTIADPKSTDLQKQRAQLAVDQAVAGLERQRQENARLAEDKAASDKAGIEGSKQVQNAQEALIAAQQREVEAQEGVTRAVQEQARSQAEAADQVTAAQRDLTDAVRDAARQQGDSQKAIALAEEQASRSRVKDAEDVADAHRKVADAVRDSAEQQRKSAESIASAQQAVVSAQRGVQQASQSAGAAGGAAFETMQQKLDALSPAGRAFVSFITDQLLPALRPLGTAAQTAVLPGLQSALTALLPTLPGVTRLIKSFGHAVGDLAGEAVDALRDPVWQSFFDYLQSDGADILRTVARTVGNFGKAFAGLVVAFKPVTDAILGGLLSLSRRFADFAANASPDSPLGRFIAYIQEIGPQVASTFAAIGEAVGHILFSLAPLAPVALAVVGALAGLISALPPPVIAAIAVGIGLLAVSMSIAGIVAGILAAQMVLIGGVAVPLVAIVAGVIAILVALGVGLTLAWQRSETFRAVVKAVWAGVQVAVTGAWAVIRAVFLAVVSFVQSQLVPVFQTYLLPVIRAVWGAIQIAIQVAWVAIQIIFKSMQIAIKILGGIFSDLYTATIKPVWELIKPVFSALGGFITDHVVPAFKTGVAAIGKAWAGIVDAAKTPVRFVVDTVINKGIIDTFNKVASFFKVDPVEHVTLPKGFATGGYVSGAGGPREDKIPAMLSNGEFVINAAAVDRIGLSFLDYINQGGSFGGDPGGVARFARGGLVEDTMRWLPSVDPLPYRWGAFGPNSFDCSGLVGEVFARVSDQVRNHRYFTTSSNLGQFGFAPGPGLFSVGVRPGQHMVGNLGGLGFEARSTATGIFVGPSATSPLSMPQVLHLASMPGGSKTPDGISLLHPIDSFKALFAGALDGAERFDGNPFGHLALAMPKTLTVGIGDFISDAVPGFADGDLVQKYDQGGYLPPGLSTVVNMTGKPEPVLTSGQWSSMREGGGKGVTINQTINNPAPEVPSESLTRSLRRVQMFGLIPQ